MYNQRQEIISELLVGLENEAIKAQVRWRKTKGCHDSTIEVKLPPIEKLSQNQTRFLRGFLACLKSFTKNYSVTYDLEG